MNKDAEVPKVAAIGLIVLVVAVLGFFLVRNVARPPAQVDVETLTPERLEDPDRGPGGGATGAK